MNSQSFKKIKKHLIFCLFMLSLFFSIYSAKAAFIKSDVFTEDTQDVFTAEAAGYEDVTGTSMLKLVQSVINVFLSLIGVILLTYLLYAGYNWMTAQGDEEKVTKAKETIQRAIIGIIIIIAAYAISIFVMSKLEVGTLKTAATIVSPFIS